MVFVHKTPDTAGRYAKPAPAGAGEVAFDGTGGYDYGGSSPGMMRMAHTFLLLALLAYPQDDLKLEATLRDVPGDGAGKRPVLLCEGTANLPDRSRLDLWLHFGEVRQGCEVTREAVEVQGGKFSCEIAFYTPPRNLAGLHTVRVGFEPHLQKPPVLEKLGDRARRLQAQVQLQAGSALDAEQDRQKWCKALGRDIEAMIAFADQAEARYSRDKDARKFDPKEWEGAYRDASDGCVEILRRAVSVPEYKALGLTLVSDVGLEELRGIVLHFIRSCHGALAHPDHPLWGGVLREARIVMARSRQRYMGFLFPVKGDAKLLTGLGEDVRKILQGALETDEAGRAKARAKFRVTLITLDSRAPGVFHESIILFADKAAAFFEALDAGREKARPLLEALDRDVQELLEDFKALK